MHGDIKNNNIVYNIMEGFKFIDFNLSENYSENDNFLKNMFSEFFLHNSLYAPPENKIFGYFIKQNNPINID